MLVDHPDYYYWELVELVRRTVLTGWVLFMDNVKRNSFARIIVGVLVSLVILVLTMARRPYLNQEDQFLAVGSQVLARLVGSYWLTLSGLTRRMLSVRFFSVGHGHHSHGHGPPEGFR